MAQRLNLNKNDNYQGAKKLARNETNKKKLICKKKNFE
jgi:hypothetical protein